MTTTDVYLTLSSITTPKDFVTVSITEVVATSDNNQDGLLEALQTIVPNLDTCKIVDMFVVFEDDRYPYPDMRYKDSIPTNEQWDSILNDMEYFYKEVDSSTETTARAYINICLHQLEVLTARQFDQYAGGLVLPYAEQGKYLYEQGLLEVPDELYYYINWAAVGEDYYRDREITDPDPYTGEQWVIDN